MTEITTTTLRVDSDLYARVKEKCKTVPGGISFNSFVLVALEQGLKLPNEELLPPGPEENRSVKKKTLLAMLHPHIASELLNSFSIPYAQACKLISASIKYDDIHPLVESALNTTIEKFEKMQ